MALDCPDGYSRCPDGTCTAGSCLYKDTCPTSRPVQCSDGSCVLSPEDCDRDRECGLENECEY